jgi:hypothetical protein
MPLGVGALALAGVVAAQPALANPRTSASTSFSVTGQLNGVAAVSASQAWAVGYAGKITGTRHPLIARWTGTAWQQVPGLSSQAGDLEGVAAVSRTDAWAVGFTLGSSLKAQRALILRWNGTKWERSPIPSLGFAGLYAVAATSATNAWAVGSKGFNLTKPVVLHWNGHVWKPVSGIGGPCVIDAISATGSSNAWAAYYCSSGGPNYNGLAHWNGSKWKSVKFPLQGVYDYVYGIAARSASNAIAVGAYAGAPGGGARSMRWNGRTWQKLAIPEASKRGLSAVAATPRIVLAVGASGKLGSSTKTLIMRWTGSGWVRLASPSPGSYDTLTGVAAVTATNAWAVGYDGIVPEKTLILHWNGSSWR